MSFSHILDIFRYWFLPVIDIIVVAYILYKTYMILYETKASLVLNGLIIVLSIYFTSIILKLDTLNLLMKLFFTYGIIMFIIVFQPEIRKALMRVGEYKLFFHEPKTNITRLTEILNGVKYMAKKKVGALIIIKRRSGMKNIEETGFKLDAHITSELIISIFTKNTPLHDGAIIIDNDRLSFASCFLPLSEKKLPKHFGSRHRAALGLSEDTDAVIIIVSEETGNITLAYKNELITELNEISLVNELNKIFKEKV